MIQEAYLVGGWRTAVTRARRGGFRQIRSDELAIQLIKGIMDLQFPDLDPAQVDDLIVGNAVPEAEQGLQMGRIIAHRALGVSVPGVTLNRYCASGLDALALATARIRAGMADCILAGGTESMSLVPASGWKTMPQYAIALEAPDYYLSMGLTAEEVARQWKVSREDQDAYALSSHQKALKARDQGLFQSGIFPMEVKVVDLDEEGRRRERTHKVEFDEGPRADTSREALSRLPPVFAKGGTVTAGNASQTSDGAAFMLVASERMVKEMGWSPWGRILSCSVAGVDPRVMGIGPVKAVPMALKQAGLRQEDLGLIELNEAFASQTLAVIRELDLDPAKVNPHGGAIALGHPLGCSGAKLAIQNLLDLARGGHRYGMVTACVGGGQGIAAVLENLRR